MDLKDKSLFIQKCFINGHWLDAESEETFDVMNPSDQTKVGTMPNCSRKDTVKAIEAAKKSWNNWKKLTGKDISDYDIHIQFVDTHGVDGDSASITIATAVISALEDIPIRQDLAMTGSLSVRGEVLPIGGVTAKIEAAAGSGIKKVVVPRSNMQDVLLDDKYKDMIEVVAVDSLDEVMKHALIKHEHKESLVERLSSVIDILTPEVSKKSPSA